MNGTDSKNRHIGNPGARAKAYTKAHRDKVDLKRAVFIDETWIKVNMAQSGVGGREGGGFLPRYRTAIGKR